MSEKEERPCRSAIPIHRACSTPGHCRTCARQAGLLDHYDRAQGEEARLRRTVAYAEAAHRYALWALGSSGVGVLLATLALLTR